MQTARLVPYCSRLTAHCSIKGLPPATTTNDEDCIPNPAFVKPWAKISPKVGRTSSLSLPKLKKLHAIRVCLFRTSHSEFRIQMREINHLC